MKEWSVICSNWLSYQGRSWSYSAECVFVWFPMPNSRPTAIYKNSPKVVMRSQCYRKLHLPGWWVWQTACNLLSHIPSSNESISAVFPLEWILPKRLFEPRHITLSQSGAYQMWLQLLACWYRHAGYFSSQYHPNVNCSMKKRHVYQKAEA